MHPSTENEFLQHLPHQMLVSEAPDIQIQIQELVGRATQKWLFGLRQKESQILVSSSTQRSKVPRELSKLGAEIDPRSILDGFYISKALKSIHLNALKASGTMKNIESLKTNDKLKN